MPDISGGHKPHILVVEDNPADVDLLRLALERAELDCDLTVIADGGDALALVQHPWTADSQLPDLVLLDLNLPKNDGLEVLSAMRGNPELARVSVAVLSSSSSPRDRTKMEAFGICRYITKPLGLDEYLEIGWVLKELLNRGKSEPSVRVLYSE